MSKGIASDREESVQPGQSAVRLVRIEKSFGVGSARTQVLKGASFEARLGELGMLVGPSGCGKTTLLSILAGTLDAEEGEVEVLGHRLDQLGAAALTRFRRFHIGFIFQQFNLIPTLSAAQNVSVPLLLQGIPWRAAEERACDILKRVGLAEKTREYPSRLSGGQQQRVAIARALIHEPPLILCDEPTSSLDRQTGQQVMELLRDAAADPHRCVVVVTHDSRTYHFAGRMSEMEDGRIFRVLNGQAEILEAHRDAML